MLIAGLSPCAQEAGGDPGPYAYRTGSREAIDKVLLVDVYHEFDHPYEMMQGIVTAMKPGALLFLVEFRGEDPMVPIKALHKMSKDQAVKEMEAAGLEWESSWNGLPWQHFLVFRKP